MSASALAASELRAIEKAKAMHRRVWETLEGNGTPVSQEDQELTYLHVEQAAQARTLAIMKRAEELKVAQKALRPPGEHGDGEHWFFITIRPDSDTTLQQLFNCTKNMVARACFLKGTYTFEQKGTTPEQLGFGLHTHIIASMKQRSKAEVARDTRSTLSRCNIRAIVQVDLLRKSEDIERVTAYITTYEANDGHKVVTQESDKAWRDSEGLNALYQI